MLFSAGDCPVGCGEVVFVTPMTGGPILLFCHMCMCVWPDPAALDGVGDCKELRDHGTEEKQVRPAVRAEIEAAGLWDWVVKRYDKNFYAWDREGVPQAAPTPLAPAELRAPDGGYPYAPDRWYRCRKCGEMIASATRRRGGCWCQNVWVDADFGRLSMKDESQVEALVDAKAAS
jgi:hypothetical protein